MHTTVRDLERTIFANDHALARNRERGDGDAVALQQRVREAHRFVRERPFLLGLPLALKGGATWPVVEFRQRGSRAVIVTVLPAGAVLKPGTVPLEV
jgi:hypothetical protein